MFVLRANFADSFEIQTSVEKAQIFFAEGNNYVQLMPNLDSIQTDNRGVTRWTISAEVPFIGRMKQSFAVDFMTDGELIEWLPASIETQNFLRCVAEIKEKSENMVSVKYSQFVEIRRNHARELHPLANLAGERSISLGMQAEIDRMLQVFIKKSKEKLER